jgi:hypothetical protein
MLASFPFHLVTMRGISGDSSKTPKSKVALPTLQERKAAVFPFGRVLES